MNDRYAKRSVTDEAIALVKNDNWDALAALPLDRDVTDSDAALLDIRMSDGESSGPWRRWARAANLGEGLREVGTILLNAGRDDDAFEVLSRAETLGAVSDPLMGEALARTGDWVAALPRLERAFHARGVQWELAAYRLAEYAFDIEGRFDDAVLEMARLAIPEAAEAVSLIADVLRRRGDIEGARRLLEEHIDTNPLAPVALGDLLSQTEGDAEGAERAYLVGVGRGHPYAAYRLAVLLAGLDGRAADSEMWMRRAAEAGVELARLAVDELEFVASGSTVRMVKVAAEDFDRPAWLGERYPRDLVPYLTAMPYPDEAFPPIFSVGDGFPVPMAGQLARAGRKGFRVHVSIREQEFDLTTVASAIPELVNLTIEEGSKMVGLRALESARALRDLDVRIAGSEPVDLSSLPNLDSAQVTGQHLLSVCRNPNLRVLSLRLTRASIRPVIEAPVERLYLTARHAGVLLEGVQHPERVRRLSLWKAHDVDLSVLVRFPNLEDLSLNWCNGIRGAESLVGRAFREVDVYRCRNIEGSVALRALQARAAVGAPDEPTVGPFVVFVDDEDGTADLSTSAIGWDGVAPPFVDRVLSFSGYQMEKLVVAVAKDQGLWARSVVRDSESEAMHLVFRDAASATAIADAAWAVLQDAERLAPFLRPKKRS